MRLTIPLGDPSVIKALAVAIHRRNWSNLLVMVAAVVAAGPAMAQKPTDAEISAIRKACRSDYIARCRSVPTGGAASLNCLKQNYSQNSSTCQQALRPVVAPTDPTPPTQPAASAKPATPAKP